MNNRLQFRHHTDIFNSREEAIEYIYSQIRFAEEGLAYDDKSYGFSLLAEPTVLRYKNEDDETDPHVILVIGSDTNDGAIGYGDNRFCIIDIDNTESEIEELEGEVEKAVSALSIVTMNSNSLKLYSDKTENGTIISGDVAVPSTYIFEDARKPNIILNTENGLFAHVSLTYDKDTDKITFSVNGDTEELSINNNYIVGGWYDKRDESLHLKSKSNDEISISLEDLIDEWGVEGEATNTPIVLTREEVGYGDNSTHNHVEPWQDVLKADVRLADRRFNILNKTSDGRYLYVDGLASNITYFKGGEEISVQDALNEVTKGVSNDSTNIIYEKADGYYATAMLKYINRDNKLVFTTSNSTGGTTVEEIQLNSIEAFTKVYYDSVTENLVIMYKDGSGDIQEVDIPIGEMMQDWEWDIVNEGHNVKLHKQRVIAGNDKVSADVAIYDDPDNILVDRNHELFVKGTAENIKYGRDSNVSDELDRLNAADYETRINEISGNVTTLSENLNTEISRATSEESRIESIVSHEVERSTEKDYEQDRSIENINQIIGDGFTVDGHETVTYKFNELSGKTSVLSARTELAIANIGLLSADTASENVRATSEEQRIEKKFDDKLGEGFDIRNTVRDEIEREKSLRESNDGHLQDEINALESEIDTKLRDIVNIDHSINVDKEEPSKAIVKVNLSEETINGMTNTIKLNSDGLYAGVDLDYSFNEEVGTNQLVFKTTNGTKVFDIKTNSVIDKIYYDSARESIIVEYTVNGHRMPDVVIPVGDLIDEWRVSDDTNGAIKLTKTRESGTTQDVLYAETVISSHDDNIIINDNGALYVSGAQIQQNKDDIASLSEEVNSIGDKIDNEILRAKEVEHTLENQITTFDSRLNAEIARSTSKDNEHDTRINSLNSDLSNEISNRITSDTELRDLINTEKNRAIEKEASIESSLNTEISARENGEDLLNTKIEAETNRAEIIESGLRSDLNNEVSRSNSEDIRLETKIDGEITRATTKDDSLQGQISDEVLRASSAENAISSSLAEEIANRRTEDITLQTQITSEVSRAQGVEDLLDEKIEAEKEARATEDAKIWNKIRPIEFHDTTTVHIERTRNQGENPDEIRNSVILSQSNNNIIIANDTFGGLYATARLGYNESANALTLYGPNDNVINTVTLGPGSIIKDISYDHVEKDLVITYRRAGETEDTVLKFPVADLFNEWDIQNPSEGSALELHKVNQTSETGNVDILWGRVLIAGAVERPDGTIDYGDNLIRIVNNGLYVDGSAMIDAKDIALCTRSELREIEKAVIGYDLSEDYDCGNGFKYSPFEMACFISAATSMYDADKILDYYLCSAHTRITDVEEDVKCLWKEVNITQENVIGIPVPPCGINGDGTPFKYPAPSNACIISAATSMHDADILLDRALCGIMDGMGCTEYELKSVENALGITGDCSSPIYYPKTSGCLLSAATSFAEADAIIEQAICSLDAQVDIHGGETPTASIITEAIDEENVVVKSNVRLSHGNDMGKWQTDEELTIETASDDEFTDTNVLRKVEINGGEPDNNYNGLYLSNVWDCGQYTQNGEGTPYEKYKTDETDTAQNIFNRKFRNGVRYQNI